MNKNYKIALGIVAIIVIALIIWAVATPPTGDRALQKSLKGTTFAQFVNEGGSYRCTVSSDTSLAEGADISADTPEEGVVADEVVVEDRKIDGTVFVKDGMLRGEYTTLANESVVNLAFITREGASYTWIPDTKIGFVVNFTSSEDPDIQKSAMETYTFNLEEIGSYECYEEDVDINLFELPDGVRFQDLSF